MTAWVEAPPGWGPRQRLIGQLERLGYRIEQVGIGDDWRLVLT